MQNKTEKELRALAKSIFLDLNNGQANYKLLQENARALYEKLTVLDALDNFRGQLEEGKEENEDRLDYSSSIIDDLKFKQNNEQAPKETLVEEKKEQESPKNENYRAEEPIVQTFEIKKERSFSNEKLINDDQIEEKHASAQEFQHEIPIDEAASLFEQAPRQEEVDPFQKSTYINDQKKKAASINDTLTKKHIQVGLNDRIAFVKHLFDGSQQEFIRVLSQLNTFNAASDAKNFLTEVVKPDYNWSDKEMYEQRLVDLIERKFA
jgi:hypothetical protein